MAEPYVRFAQQDLRGRKTGVWDVLSIHDAKLGEVRFFGRWRCFVFFPMEDTVFNHGCLTDIAAFCFQRTSEWRDTVRTRTKDRT